MKRHLFTIVSILALLLCLASTVLWVRSYRVSDTYGFSESFAVWSDRGTIVVCLEHPERDPFHIFQGSFERGYHRQPLDDPNEFFNPRRVARKGWNIGVAHVETFPRRGTTAPIETFVVFELWGALILAGVLPVVWLFKATRVRARLRQNKCPRCGYDLRATRDRCPECGTPVAAKQGARA